jgi:hypothetical protein
MNKKERGPFFSRIQFDGNVGLEQLKEISQEIDNFFNDELIHSIIQKSELGVLDTDARNILKGKIHELVFTVKTLSEQSPQEIQIHLKKLQGIEKSVGKCLDSIKIFKRSPCFILKMVQEVPGKETLKKLYSFKKCIAEARVTLKKIHIKKGRPSSQLERHLVTKLIEIYRETGNKPSLPTDPSNGKGYGPLLEFVTEIIHPLFPNLSSESQIRDILYRNKSEKHPTAIGS